MPATARNKQFARLAAQGKTLVEAHEQAYGRLPKRKSQREEASHLAAKPGMRELIAKYEAEYQPIGDYRRLREEMESNIRHLAHESDDHRVRLAASKMLHDIALERERREELMRPRAVTVDAIIRELGEVAASQAPLPALELEQATEPDDDETDAEPPAEPQDPSDELDASEEPDDDDD